MSTIKVPLRLREALTKKRIINPSILINNSEPLYVESQIYQTNCQLMRCFRKYCVENNVTYKDFQMKFRKYNREVLDLPEKRVRTNVNNLKKPLYSANLSWTMFIQFTECLGIYIDMIELLTTDGSNTLSIKTTRTEPIFKDIDYVEDDDDDWHF